MDETILLTSGLSRTMPPLKSVWTAPGATTLAVIRRGRPLKPSLKLFVRALVGAHYSRPGLNRVLEAEEERLGDGAGDFAFRPGLGDLLQEHKSEIATPVGGTTERVAMAIMRAVVDQGLAVGASERSVERQALRAVSGFLLYKG